MTDDPAVLHFHCPYCAKWSEQPATRDGAMSLCPHCGREILVRSCGPVGPKPVTCAACGAARAPKERGWDVEVRYQYSSPHDSVPAEGPGRGCLLAFYGLAHRRSPHDVEDWWDDAWVCAACLPRVRRFRRWYSLRWFVPVSLVALSVAGVCGGLGQMGEGRDAPPWLGAAALSWIVVPLGWFFVYRIVAWFLATPLRRTLKMPVSGVRIVGESALAEAGYTEGGDGGPPPSGRPPSGP